MSTSFKTIKQVKSYSSFAIKLIIGLVFIFPIIVCVLFSLMPESEITRIPFQLFTKNPTGIHYLNVFQNYPIFSYVKNSFITCILALASQIIVATCSAYAFSFFDFPGKGLIFTLIISSMMIPADVVIITNFMTVQSLRLTNTYLGLVLPSLVTGTGIFMMRQYYLTIPKDLRDAATIDGCGDYRFLFKIAMPLSIPTIASLALTNFILVYNQYFWPLLVTGTDKMRTIQIGVKNIVLSEKLEYGPMLAAASISIIPPIIVFIFGQDYIVKGMTAGAVKG